VHSPNRCPNDLEEVVEDVVRSIKGIRDSTHKLRGCIVQSELPSFLRQSIAFFMQTSRKKYREQRPQMSNLVLAIDLPC
jgi:hypothetical protein